MFGSLVLTPSKYMSLFLFFGSFSGEGSFLISLKTQNLHALHLQIDHQ